MSGRRARAMAAKRERLAGTGIRWCGIAHGRNRAIRRRQRGRERALATRWLRGIAKAASLKSERTPGVWTSARAARFVAEVMAAERSLGRG